MVTRTILTTKVNVLALNIETSEPFNAIVTLPRKYDNDDKLMKKVHEVFDTETQKAVHIVNKEVVETLYGMEEVDFVKYAQILDADTRKPVQADESTDAE